MKSMLLSISNKGISPSQVLQLLQALDAKAFFDQSMLVGSWAMPLYQEAFGIQYELRTLDIDFAVRFATKNIGRNHDGKTAIESVRRAVKTGFDSVSADLMFALPGQTLQDWKSDLRAVVAEGVDQISTYPLFSFPYSDLDNPTDTTGQTTYSHAIRSMLDLTQSYAKGYPIVLSRAGYKALRNNDWKRPIPLPLKSFVSVTSFNNLRDFVFSDSHGRGRWFKPSIAHHESSKSQHDICADSFVFYGS